MSTQTGAVLEEICRRFDGIPLAIELAAAQLDVLSPVDVLDRLDRRFDLLVGGHGRRRERQRTLQAMMDWSWELLTPDERQLLAVVSVFTGQGSLEAAEAVGEQYVSTPVAGLLRALVAKSIVEPVFALERSRFRLLETVRLYAAARLLELGVADEVRAGHAQFDLATPRQIGAGRAFLDLDSMDTVVVDLIDLDAAIGWCVTSSAWSGAAELAVLAGGCWTGGVQARNGVWWVQLLEPRVPDRVLRARLLAIGGFAAIASGAHAVTRTWEHEALDLADGYGHFAGALAGLLCAAPNILPDPDEARRYLLDARAAAGKQRSPELVEAVQQWINMASFYDPTIDLPTAPDRFQRVRRTAQPRMADGSLCRSHPPRRGRPL